MSKKVLVAGSAGFIGSHLVDRLISEGFLVTGIDNFSTGQRNNFLHLEGNENFNFVEHDITKTLPDLGSFDCIINLACPASPVDYQNIPLETLWVSAMGTKNLLEYAKQSGAKFLHASTSEVYGDPLVHPQNEKYWGNVNPIGPRSCYDEGKRFAESLIVNYSTVYNLDARIFRIFNTYGPRMRQNDGRVIPNFITQALQGKKITVYGDGSQTRSFCYIDDMVDGISKILQVENFDGPMNLGNPNECTILDLAKTIVELTNSKSEIALENLPTDDPKIRNPDISKAKKEIGFEPHWELEKGLLKTIDYFKAL